MTTSRPAIGNRITEGGSVTLTCAGLLVHPDGENSRMFNCTGLDSYTPALTLCTCKFCIVATSSNYNAGPRGLSVNVIFFWTLCLIAFFNSTIL